jgi:ribonuclease HI
MRKAGMVPKNEKRITIYFDGASRGNPGHAGVGAIVYRGGSVFGVLTKYIGQATNNVAEYTALWRVLLKIESVIQDKKEISLFVRCDSELVAKQLSGAYKVKHPELKKLAHTIKKMLSHYGSWAIEHIPREENRIADTLASSAIDNALKGSGNPSKAT